MRVHRWEDVKKRKLPTAKLADIEEQARREVLEMDMRAVREMVGKTQAEVADIIDMTQSELSRAEHRDDHLLSTLKRYVTALGGELEVVAVFDDRRIRLRGV